MSNFQTISQLKRIDFNNVLSIDEAAFFGCRNLSTANISSVEYIGYGAFACTGLTGLSLPNIDYIETAAFASCLNLTSINIPISQQEKIKLYDLNKHQTDSGYVLVEDLSVLWGSSPACDHVKLPDEVQYIGKWAFNGNQNLQYIDCNKVQEFGSCAFKHCSKLNTVVLSGYDGVVDPYDDIGYSESGSFYGCDLPVSVYVKNQSMIEQYLENETWNQLTSIGQVIFVPVQKNEVIIYAKDGAVIKYPVDQVGQDKIKYEFTESFEEKDPMFNAEYVNHLGAMSCNIKDAHGTIDILQPYINNEHLSTALSGSARGLMSTDTQFLSVIDNSTELSCIPTFGYGYCYDLKHIKSDGVKAIGAYAFSTQAL